MSRCSKFTPEEMKEIIKFYEEHGGRETEKKYGFKPLYANCVVSSFKRQLVEINRITVTEFVNVSDKKTIINFIDTFNTKGRKAALTKFKIKNFSLDSIAAKYLIRLGLVIRKKSRANIDDSVIQNMLDKGLSFKKIRAILSKKYTMSLVCTVINRYKIEHNIAYKEIMVTSIVNNNIGYITTHTIAESCNKFGIDGRALRQCLWIKKIKYKDDYICDLLKAIRLDIDGVRSKVKNLTLDEISKLYDTSYQYTSKTLKEYGIDCKKYRRRDE